MKWKDIEIKCVVVWKILIIHVELKRISPPRLFHIRLQLQLEQECIPVGCVPPARYHAEASP